MRNKNLIQSLKVTMLGVSVSVGFTYVFAAWNPPSGTPSSENNAPVPINVSTTPQAKGGNVLTSTTPGFIPPLLDIQGTLSANDLAVFGNAVISNDVKINSMVSSSGGGGDGKGGTGGGTSSGNRNVCVDATGTLVVCSSSTEDTGFVPN